MNRMASTELQRSNKQIRSTKKYRTIREEFEKAAPGWCFSDVENSNIGKDAAGRFKVIDLGCFSYHPY